MSRCAKMGALPPYLSPAASSRECRSFPDMFPLFDDDEDDASDLTSLTATPSPPSSPNMSPIRPSVSPLTARGSPYPSPPRSQNSGFGTPCPERSYSLPDFAGEDEEQPPAKRRCLNARMPRDTTRLNLEELHDPQQKTELDRLVKAIKNKKKIVIVAGAGISVTAGIPDFRSSTGLFKALKAQHKLKGSGKHLFDADVYRDSNSTSTFHHMVRSLSTLAKAATATEFHHLIARLAQEGRLLRLYSQNVDGLETSLPPLATEVPLPHKGPWPKTVQLHGGLAYMQCLKCRNLSDLEPDLFDGPIPPECRNCHALEHARTSVAGKRSHGVGMLRPRMVLYNEANPDDEAIGRCVKSDMRTRPDCVIVVGTSLKIPGLKRIVREMCGIVRDHRDGLSVWINNDYEPHHKDFADCWDIIVKGTSDAVALHAGLRKWDDEETEDPKARLVTECEVAEIRERGQPKVIVESPQKHERFKNIDSLPTPIESPVFGPKADPEDTPFANEASLTNRSTSKQAVRGRPRNDALTISVKKASNAKVGPKRPVGRPPGSKNINKHKSAVSKPVNRQNNKSKATKATQINFPVQKQVNITIPDQDKPKLSVPKWKPSPHTEIQTPQKPQPLKTSPTRGNVGSNRPPKWMGQGGKIVNLDCNLDMKE